MTRLPKELYDLWSKLRQLDEQKDVPIEDAVEKLEQRFDRLKHVHLHKRSLLQQQVPQVWQKAHLGYQEEEAISGITKDVLVLFIQLNWKL